MDATSNTTEPPTVISPAAGQRIGDEEREQAAKRIVAAVGSGHLTVAEADKRIARVYEARWPADLDLVLADLPGAHPVGAPPPLPPPRSPAPARPGSRIPVVPVLLLAFGVVIGLGPVLQHWTVAALPIVLGIALLARWSANTRAAGRP